MEETNRAWNPHCDDLVVALLNRFEIETREFILNQIGQNISSQDAPEVINHIFEILCWDYMNECGDTTKNIIEPLQTNIDWLIQKGLDFNWQDSFGRTFLHRLVYRVFDNSHTSKSTLPTCQCTYTEKKKSHEFALFEFLLKLPIDQDIIDHEGNTPHTIISTRSNHANHTLLKSLFEKSMLHENQRLRERLTSMEERMNKVMHMIESGEISNSSMLMNELEAGAKRQRRGFLAAKTTNESPVDFNMSLLN